MKRLQVTTATLILALAALAAATTVPRRGDADEEPADTIKHVRVEPARGVDTSERARFSGVTRGAKSAMASFTVGGRLERRPVEIGDRVRRGQAIATVDGREFSNGLASTRASLAEISTRLSQARRDARRSQALFEREAATREELEKVASSEEVLQAQHDAVAARVAELERLVDESTLYAPIDGTVSEVFLEPGEYAGPGQPVVAVSGRDGVEVEIELPEAMALDLKLGDKVEVAFPLLHHAPVAGQVTSLASSSLGPGRLFPVIVAIDGFDGLIPGLTAEIAINRRREDGLAVPVEAVLNPGGREAYLFVVRDRIARRLPVDVRRLHRDGVIVDGAIQRGELVVVDGQFSLIDADPVEITGPTELAMASHGTALQGD